MTRRTRRRLLLLGTATAVAASLPFWAPRILATLPAFRVASIEVVGARYVPPDEIVRLAAVDSFASVWDDPVPWETGIRAHRLIREVRVQRRGLRTLEIRVVEDRPVALIATPTLVPVNAEGWLLPLDPAVASLDLPLLAGRARVDNGRLPSGTHRDLAAILGRLEEYDPAFTSAISEIRMLAGDAVEVRLLESAHCHRILLPAEAPVLGLRRVELALGSVGQRALLADARFKGQVVLRLVGGP